MFRFIFLVLIFPSVTCAFKVMSLNLWQEGYGYQIKDQIRKFGHQIRTVNPDIVAVQETGNKSHSDKTISSLLEFLGDGWEGVMHCNGGAGVLTQHRILGLYEHVSRGMNVRIRLNESGYEISFWSMRLDPQPGPYGPYEISKGNATTLDKILSTTKTHMLEIAELLKHPEFVNQINNSENVPVIFAADLNTPSHLDYIYSTRDIHNGWVVDWPVTKTLSGSAGMTDSFREVHPDPKSNPGITWRIYKKNYGVVRRQDRIDYIFYRGSLRPISSYTYSGKSAVIDDEGSAWKNNEWPSDHWAVVTEFERTWPKYENTPSFFMESEYSKVNPKAIEKCPIDILH